MDLHVIIPVQVAQKFTIFTKFVPGLLVCILFAERQGLNAFWQNSPGQRIRETPTHNYH
jgi:hypothetical protein